MRNGQSRVTAVAPQETLPEFIQIEQALIDKLEALQNNLNNELNEISENDRIEISSSSRNKIRRILFEAQRALGNMARTYAHSNTLLNFYRDVNQFIQMVDEMEMMFCQTLQKCAPKKEASEEDLLLLGLAESDSVSTKTAEALFSEFSADNKANLLSDHSDMINQIERVGELSGAVYAASREFDKNSQGPNFLTRFFDARRIVSEAIEKIHHVIHDRDEASNQNETRRRSRSTSSASEECCYEFGLISLCSEMKNQVRDLLKKNNKAQAERIKILKMICSLANKVPESLSSADTSGSYTSSESSCGDRSTDAFSSNDSSRASSPVSSGLFSRSWSPEPKNPNQSSNLGARLG